MANYNATFIYTTGGTLSAYPMRDSAGDVVSLADWATYRAACTEGAGDDVGIYSVTVTDDFNEWAVLDAGASQPTDWSVDTSVRIYIRDWATDVSLAGVVVTLTSPVSTDGQIVSPIVIGDDYLDANDRAFVWTIPAVTGYTAATATCYFGLAYKAYSMIVEGDVADIGGGEWTLTVDVAKTDTADLVPAHYQWSVEVRSAGGTEITRVRGRRTVELVRKQT